MMSEAHPGGDRRLDDRQIAIHRDAIGSAIVSGDGNKVFIYHYQLDRPVEAPSTLPSTLKLGANPYRGLAAFQVEDAAVFFGREDQVERLWGRLREFQERATQANPPVRLLPILGASGSGKSSLARAGLLPELARKPLPGYRQPRVVVMTPGSSPLQSLAIVLARIATGDPTPVEKAAEFERVLGKANEQGQTDGLRRIANALPNIEQSPLVVLIDQFEEVYSLCKDIGSRDRFIGTLIEAAATPEARVSVVITFRSDFLSETQKHPQLDQIIGSDQCVVVTAMTTADLRRSIAEPAKQAGHPLDDALIDRLVEQTEGREGALPLLQFALTRIWEGLKENKSPSETLKAIGGVGGALAGEAQRIYANLGKVEQDMARRVFVGLVQLGEGTKDTRRRAAVDSLISAKDDPVRVRQVLDLFSAPGARLITRSTVEGEEVVEVTHEALLEHWQQIKDWLDGRRDRIRQQRRINASAVEWAKQGKKAGYLLQGRQLDDARAFQKRYVETLPLSECAAEFVRKSLRQRSLGRAAIASFLILPFIVVDSFLREEALKRDYATLRSEDVSGKPEAAQALVRGCKYWSWSSPSAWFAPLGERVFGNCKILEGQNLAKTDLHTAYLSNAYLSNANLNYADLRHANLSNANLNNADLGNANLSFADLRNAKLISANLRNANLYVAYLHYADLRDANLDNTDFRHANLSFADLRNAKPITQAQLAEAILCNTKLPPEIKLNPDRDCNSPQNHP